MDGQARQALAANREDLARSVLQRKATAQQQLNDLDTQIGGLDTQEQKLADAEAKLQPRLKPSGRRKKSSRLSTQPPRRRFELGRQSPASPRR